MNDFRRDPAEIERLSMEIITAEMGEGLARFSAEEAAVVKRVIHTTADFSYADLFTASPGAVQAGIDALRQGARFIVSDTNMIVAGVNRLLLEKLGAGVACLVAERETAEAARSAGVTRSMINIRRAAALYPGAIFALGNAPTALFELLRLCREGQTSPPLVIGVPVGFVGAAESKEALVESDLPYITVRGRKGGSPVAVAVLNALMGMAVA